MTAGRREQVQKTSKFRNKEVSGCFIKILLPMQREDGLLTVLGQSNI